MSIREQLKKRLCVPENWDKYDYAMQIYSFDDILEVAEELVKSELAVVIPSGKDWDKFMVSPSILETKRGATAYEAGFKDCIIEIKKRIREYERNNR